MSCYILSNKNTHHKSLYLGAWFVFLGILIRISVSYSIHYGVYFSGKTTALLAFAIGAIYIIHYLIKSNKSSQPHITIKSSGIVIANLSDTRQKKQNNQRIPWESVATIYFSDNNSDTEDNGPSLHIVCINKTEIIFSLHDYKLGYNSYQMIRAIKYYSGREDIIKPECKYLWLITLSNPFINSIKES